MDFDVFWRTGFEIYKNHLTNFRSKLVNWSLSDVLRNIVRLNVIVLQPFLIQFLTVQSYIFQPYQVLQLVNLVLISEPKNSKEKKSFGIMMYSNLLFITFFVVLIIKYVSLPNLSICRSIYISNSSVFVFAIFFLIFTDSFQEGLKSFYISDAG